jgi:prepilin-type N-terminal cleavage/methylation domain-containing protein
MKLFFHQDNRGITLLELIVVISISLIIIMGAVSLFRFGFFSRDVVWEQLKTQNEGRRVIQDFVNELRSASQSSIGAYSVEKASSTEFIFYSNIDADTYKERVRYYLDGTNFKKGVTKPAGNPLKYTTSTETSVIIAHDVVNTSSTPPFIYYGQGYDGLASSTALASPVNITLVRVVKVQLLMEADPKISPAPFFVDAVAQIRPLKPY